MRILDEALDEGKAFASAAGRIRDKFKSGAAALKDLESEADAAVDAAVAKAKDGLAAFKAKVEKVEQDAEGELNIGGTSGAKGDADPSSSAAAAVVTTPTSTTTIAVVPAGSEATPVLTGDGSVTVQPGTTWADGLSGLDGRPLATARFGDVGEGAAGSYTLGEVLRLFDGRDCWEIEPRLALTRFENYPPGQVREFTEADRNDVEQLFWEVLRSATVLTHRVTWPEEGSSCPSGLQFRPAVMPENGMRGIAALCTAACFTP